jgi:hypothetical protein
MLLETHFPRTLTAPAPTALPLRLVPGALYWRSVAQEEITVRLMLVPRSRIQVDLWWNRRGGDADVQLVLALYGDSVELGSLTGNGFDAPHFHRMGFGTLVVNVGIQAVQAVCAAPVLVHGVLSNTVEDGLPDLQQAELAHARRAFWRRFGLDVVARGSPPLDYLRGTVGGMQLVMYGLLAGQFARSVPIDAFERTRPEGF